MKLTILSIRYEEFSWLKTRECCEATGLPVVYVDRNPKGIGSLSEAINRGMEQVKTDYVFIVTNINFNPDVPNQLLSAMESNPDFAAICPVYDSDHAHLRPGSYEHGRDLREVPFIELTALIARTSLMKEFTLDEDMPYVGNDLDVSHRLKQAGHKLGSLKSCAIEHSYIRKMEQSGITKKRLSLRKKADQPTIAKLRQKYGNNWRDTLCYHNGIASR